MKTKIVNVINQAWHLDGTVDISIYKEGWNKAYKFKIKDYGKKTEKVLEDEEVRETT